MVKDLYSYWLDAKPAIPGQDPDAFLSALSAAGLLVPEGCLVASVDDGCVTAEVDPDEGAAYEDDSLRGAIGKIAAAFPGFRVELQENDEEDTAHQVHTVWEGGQIVRQGFARLIAADEDYDQVTVDAIAEALEAQPSMAGAAAFVRTRFAKT